MGHARDDFHVRRDTAAASDMPLRRPLIGLRGDLVVTDTAGIRRLAARMNAARPAGSPSVQAGEIGALGLLHEVGHLLIARYEADVRPGAMVAALADLEDRFGPDSAPPPRPVRRGVPGCRSGSGARHRAARGAHPHPGRERESRRSGQLHELVDDRTLVEETRYRDAIARLEMSFADGPPVGDTGLSLLDLIRQPARHAPTSLAAPAALRPGPVGRHPGREPRGADPTPRRDHRHPRRGGAGTAPPVRWRRRWRCRGWARRGPDRDPVVRCRRRGGRGVLIGFGLDAARRAHGQEHLRLARPAVADVRARHPDARCHPG